MPPRLTIDRARAKNVSRFIGESNDPERNRGERVYEAALRTWFTRVTMPSIRARVGPRWQYEISSAINCPRESKQSRFIVDGNEGGRNASVAVTDFDIDLFFFFAAKEKKGSDIRSEWKNGE